MTDHATPEQPAVTGEPTCPTCSKPLEEVRYRGGYLNRDQWESVRAGDWWCETCPSNGRGRSGAYYWSREVLSTLDPVSRTLGATDSPREDSTDVDPTASELVDAHIRIAELETLNAAHEVTIASLNERLPEFARLHRELSSTRTALQRADRLARIANQMVKLGMADARSPLGDAVLDYSSFRFGDTDPIAALTSSETDQ